MERKGEVTKRQLADSFKELMLKGPFDKITIRMITEQAGVIRPTFYNYFQDKYEVMEWLLDEEVFSRSLRCWKKEWKEKPSICCFAEWRKTSRIIRKHSR